jgi:hypothetical protein
LIDNFNFQNGFARCRQRCEKPARKVPEKDLMDVAAGLMEDLPSTENALHLGNVAEKAELDHHFARYVDYYFKQE